MCMYIYRCVYIHMFCGVAKAPKQNSANFRTRGQCKEMAMQCNASWSKPARPFRVLRLVRPKEIISFAYVYIYIHIYIYIYIRVYIHIHVCIYIYIYIHVCIYIYTHVYIYRYIHSRLRVFMYMHVCVYIYIYIYTHVCVGVCVCVCVCVCVWVCVCVRSRLAQGARACNVGIHKPCVAKDSARLYCPR